MDWDVAIERNRTALLRLVVSLFAMAGLAQGGAVSVLPRHLRRAVLSRLRPTEASLRRLVVVIAARLLAAGLVIAPPQKRSAPSGPIPQRRAGRTAPFDLFDPRKRIGPRARRASGAGPRIFGLDNWEPAPPQHVPQDDDPMDAAQLCARLAAAKAALEDLPKQALRLLRAEARRTARANLKRAMRPGRPPGHRSRGRREIDALLAEVHRLALWALMPVAPDTS